MGKTVILDFADDEDSDVDDLVDSLNNNRGIMVIKGNTGMHKIYPEVSGVYTKIYAIEGEE